tara:strand:- start:1960 stop:2898 length:939 start_codon:yes stop_codon:yes gene_type:complete
MRRKLIKQGNNSYTLTLPINWIRDNKIQENAEIEISEKEGDLSISLPKDSKHRTSSVELDLGDYNERTIRNVLNQTYRKGYDEIILSYNTKEQLKYIRQITRTTLLGFETVKEEGNKCYIQNIAEPSDEKFSVILRKIFHIIQDESSEIVQDIKGNNLKNKDKYQETKDILDNYTNFCRRLIIKKRIPDSKNSYLLMTLVSRLSLIYHALYYMYKFASSKNNIKLTNKTFELLSEIPDLFILLHESFYEKDLEKAHQIGVIKDKLIFSSIYDKLTSTKGSENIILYHTGEIVRLIHLASINIFGLTDLEKIN